MSEDKESTKNPKHYLQTLMKLSANEVSDIFLPILDKQRESKEFNPFLDDLEDELTDIIFDFDSSSLPEDAQFALKASMLLNNLFNTMLNYELTQHLKTTKNLESIAQSAIRSIEQELEKSTDLESTNQAITKELTKFKEEMADVNKKRIAGGKKPPSHYRENAAEIEKLLQRLVDKEITNNQFRDEIFKLTKARRT
jgi:hypothetical protein